ncbi:hypothetical protein [Marinobacter sp. F4206]|uniref:hypothetical protein n=1 Tax=Marinobacter sp. F4206 TaxID=2861777 RepID=UPI001C5CF724|nr:hypothetical protein [Marinobacter sp. F4206]MBW4935908.1 hypothetical protein [Marinobacter sp. F4206]
MKRVLICSATLALTLFVAPSYGDNWERKSHHQGMMMAQQTGMYSDMGMQNRQASVEERRRVMLERGAVTSVDYVETGPQRVSGYATTTGEVRSIEDIENLPSTAAGYPDDRGMHGRDGKKDWRTGHRGRIHHEY